MAQALSQNATDEGELEKGSSTTIDRDNLFHILRNHRRRYALHYLRRHEETDIGELADQIAAWENRIDRSRVDATQRKRVYNSLQQTHLPELDENGVVDYDKRSGTVAVTNATDDIDIYLELVPGREIPWSKYYLGLGTLGLTLVLAAVTNTPLIGGFSGIAYAAFIAVALTISAAVNVHYQRRNRIGEGDKPPDLRREER